MGRDSSLFSHRPGFPHRRTTRRRCVFGRPHRGTEARKRNRNRRFPCITCGIPSTLKAYIDHISRAGETFQYAGKPGRLGF
ncbi:NAD(P)H-dependent oxidoreductase [Cupriavidus basilensis]